MIIIFHTLVHTKCHLLYPHSTSTLRPMRVDTHILSPAAQRQTIPSPLILIIQPIISRRSPRRPRRLQKNRWIEEDSVNRVRLAIPRPLRPYRPRANTSRTIRLQNLCPLPRILRQRRLLRADPFWAHPSSPSMVALSDRAPSRLSPLERGEIHGRVTRRRIDPVSQAL